MSMPEDLGRVRAQREGVRRSMERLELALTAPADARWWDAFRDALEGLRDAFDRHVRLTEAEGGLLDEVVHEAPRLAHARDVLLDEHVDITKALEALASVDDVDAARSGAIAVLGSLVRHRHKGADLLYEAYSVDISESD